MNEIDWFCNKFKLTLQLCSNPWWLFLLSILHLFYHKVISVGRPLNITLFTFSLMKQPLAMNFYHAIGIEESDPFWNCEFVIYGKCFQSVAVFKIIIVGLMRWRQERATRSFGWKTWKANLECENQFVRWSLVKKPLSMKFKAMFFFNHI